MTNVVSAALDLSSVSTLDKRSARATYDFAADGGATGSLTLFSFNQAVIVHKLWFHVETACTSGGSATLDAEVVSGTANGFFDAVAVAGLTLNALFKANELADLDALLAKLDADEGITDTNYGATFGNNAGAVKLPLRVAADGEIQMTINVEALTAGKINFYCEYSNAPA